VTLAKDEKLNLKKLFLCPNTMPR